MITKEMELHAILVTPYENLGTWGYDLSYGW